jgi:hypothetical protein
MKTTSTKFDLNQEYILCSAIWYETGLKPKDPRCLPRNKETGICVCGHRHHNCFGILYELQKGRANLSICTEGFLTSKGNFLDRNEALILAKKTGQIIETEAYILTSEDLW